MTQNLSVVLVLNLETFGIHNIIIDAFYWAADQFFQGCSDEFNCIKLRVWPCDGVSSTHELIFTPSLYAKNVIDREAGANRPISIKVVIIKIHSDPVPVWFLKWILTGTHSKYFNWCIASGVDVFTPDLLQFIYLFIYLLQFLNYIFSWTDGWSVLH